MTDETVLETRDLVKRFGAQVAVDHVSIGVRRGDIYGFLGLNGAGKTTTMKCLLGLLRPDAGSVSLFGRDDAAGRLDGLRDVGAMVEGPAFYGHLSGAGNLKLLGGLSARVEGARIETVLRQVGLWDARSKKARNYSLGMKQRLGIALALVSEPSLVILDEPTNGLDPNGILEMRRLIRRLNQDDGVTFVISSHLLHEIELVCNRVGILEEGRLIVEQDIDTMLQKLGGRFALRADPRDGARTALESFEGTTLVDGPEDGALRFVIDDDSRLPSLHRHLAAASVDVRTLSEERVSLEEFFIKRSADRGAGTLT